MTTAGDIPFDQAPCQEITPGPGVTGGRIHMVHLPEQPREVNEVRKIIYLIQNIVKTPLSPILNLNQFPKVHMAIKNIFPLSVNLQLIPAGRLRY